MSIPYYQLNRELGQSVLFAQKRIGENFATIGSGAPDYIYGRSIYDVAEDLKKGLLTSDDILIKAYEYNGSLVTVNNRGLATLSLADLLPTNIKIVTPTTKELARLRENPISRDLPIPGPRIAVTLGQNDLTVKSVIRIPN